MLPMQSALPVVREFFLAAFIVMFAIYLLRMLGMLKSPHDDKTTDAAHLLMAAAMFAMIMWPGMFM